jgi:hypothetical protein
MYRHPSSTAVLGLALLFGAGCPEPAPSGPNYDALPDIGTPDSTTGDQPGNPDGSGPDGDAGPLPDNAIDITTDIVAPPGTVKALQLEAEAAGCDPAQIQTIGENKSLTQVVVTSPKWDAFTPSNPGGTALDGYFVADADGGQWSGIHVTIPRDDATDYQPGTLLDLTGTLIEFYCQTQLTATSHTPSGSGGAVTPLVVPPVQVATEAYEVMLLRVNDVEVTQTIAGGVYRMTGGFIVDHAFDFFLELVPGTTYTITGILMYQFDEYRLMPRFESDVVGSGPTTSTTIAALQTSSPSTNCTNPANTTIGQDLTLDATVVVPLHDVSAQLGGYYLSEGAGGPNSGISAVIAKNQGTDWAVGTQVRVTGRHVEYYCMTQFSIDSFEELGPGGTVPAPVPMLLSELAASPEQWEGSVVELSGVTVQNVTQYNEGDLDGTGILVDDSIMGSAFPTLTSGTTWGTLIGAVSYSFDAYRISPRSAADMVVGGIPDPQPEAAVEAMPDAAAEATPDAAAEAMPDASDGGSAPDASGDGAGSDAADAGGAPDAGPDAPPDVTGDGTPD